ncbi:hypothetical protein A9Q81_21050 [Gammaproteobacteria bacterium 42_54_T18]|nr:hypothetical protein A9Q81_21050 [Gammaproteobacteria bacterium 42_54_T18]
MIIVHRIIFLSLMLTCFIWSDIALKVNYLSLLFSFDLNSQLELLKFTYISGAAVGFWFFFFVEIMDTIYSALGKNGSFFKNFFISIKNDLVVGFMSPFVLLAIYLTDGSPYIFTGIDIGGAGIGFIIMAFIRLNGARKMKIAGKRINLYPLIIIFVIMALYSYSGFVVLQRNSSGSYDSYQSLWFQITIFFGSFYFYMTASYVSHFVSKGKFGVSDFKMYFMRDVMKLDKFFNDELIEAIQKANKEMERSKSISSSKKRKR